MQFFLIPESQFYIWWIVHRLHAYHLLKLTYTLLSVTCKIWILKTWEGFAVFTAVSLRILFWDMTLYQWAIKFWYFMATVLSWNIRIWWPMDMVSYHRRTDPWIGFFLGYIAQVIYQDEACWPLELTVASYVPVVILLRYKLFCHFNFYRKWHCARFYFLIWQNSIHSHWYLGSPNHIIWDFEMFFIFLIDDLFGRTIKIWNSSFFWIRLLFISTCTVAATGICCCILKSLNKWEAVFFTDIIDADTWKVFCFEKRNTVQIFKCLSCCKPCSSFRLICFR